MKPRQVNILDRIPPHNTEAELGVIGSILIDPSRLDEIAQIVTPDDFYTETARRVFSHLLAIQAEGKPVDVLLLLERIESSGDLENIGGEAEIARAASSVPLAHNAVYYARIVLDRAERRRVIEATLEAAGDSFDTDRPITEILAKLDDKLLQVSGIRQSLISSQEAMDQTIEDISRSMNRQSRVVRIGLKGMDRHYGGLGSSELTILAARPGVGKSAMALQIAEHIATHNGPVLFVSLEMSVVELSKRRMSRIARLDSTAIRQGIISDEEFQELIQAASQLVEIPVFLWPNAGASVADIGRATRTLKRQFGCHLVVVDYIGLVKPSNSRDVRQEQVAKISRGLKFMAQELDVPVLVLSQLNREAAAAKPKLSHLRESGAIEQDADCVIMLHRPDEATDTEMSVEKHRHGQVRTFSLNWHPSTTTFSDIKPEGHAEFAEHSF